MLRAARDAGIEMWVCLHHFTLPGWFAVDERGFVDERSRSYFWPRHVDFIGETFGDLVFGWKPSTSRSAYALLGWLLGLFPPGHATDADSPTRSKPSTSPHSTPLAAAQRRQAGGHDPQPGSVRTLADTPEASQTARQLDAVMWTCWLDAFRNDELQVPDHGPVEVPGFAMRSIWSASPTTPHTAWRPTDDRALPRRCSGRPDRVRAWSEGLGEVLHRLAEVLPDKPLLVAEHGSGPTTTLGGSPSARLARRGRAGGR